MRGSILPFEKSQELFSCVLSYGNDKNQISYALDFAKKKFFSLYPQSIFIEIDLKSQKNPIDYLRKTISKENNFFVSSFFVHLLNLPEKSISDLINFHFENIQLNFFVDASHIPLLYKSIGKYDIRPDIYLLAAYPFKNNEKNFYISSYLQQHKIQIAASLQTELVEILSDDFLELQQQLERLNYFTLDKQEIMKSDICLLFESNSKNHIDTLFLQMLLGQNKAKEEVLNLTQNNQFDPHFVSRSFLKYLKKIYYVISQDSQEASQTPLASLEGLSPYVLKLLLPHIPTFQKKYGIQKLFQMIQETNQLEENLRVTQKDPIQTLNQFWIQFNYST